MEKELIAIEKFMQSLQDARTRCGVAFKCCNYEIGRSGNSTKALGEVYIQSPTHGETIPLSVKWGLDGISSLGPDFDLIIETAFDE